MTAEQILALAPDPASAKAGRGLAVVGTWPSLGCDAVALWGECKGSGATPYQARVERATIGYACSCPSRKFPCKHVIGLLLLDAAGSVPAAVAPPWVADWLAKRTEKAASRATSVPKGASDSAAPANAETAAKRAKQRETRVAAGVEELDLWLGDLLRLGLARVQTESPRFWEAKAARLVDAQAPGLARRVRDLATLGATGDGWDTRLLDAFGALHLLCEGYGRIASLSDARRADVRRYIGWTQREDEVLARPGAIATDRWFVLGTRTETDERFVAHRAWLRGERSGRDALVMQFAMPGAPLAHTFASGASFDGEIAYYEASVPQRALVVARADRAEPAAFPLALDARGCLERYAQGVAADPWFETLGVVLAVTRTSMVNDAWFVEDSAGRVLPIARAFGKPFALHALCGGRPLVVSAEWNGRALFPLAAFADERCIALG